MNEYTFDNYIANYANSVVLEYCKQVAGDPGNTSMNPLCIYGPPGVGKTHLAKAILNEVQQNHKGAKVIYTDADGFTTDFLHAAKNHNIKEFKDKYQSALAVVIEDGQLLVSRNLTRELFLKIVFEMRESGRQLIITMDRNPRDHNGDERVSDLLKWGLTLELVPPTEDEKYDLLKSFCKRTELDLPDKVINYMVQVLPDNVGVLKGVISTLSNNLSERNGVSYEEVVRELSYLMPRIDWISVGMVQTTVSEYYDVSVEDMCSDKRDKKTSLARNASIFSCTEFTSKSATDIAKAHGGRPASAVMYAIKRIEYLMDSDGQVDADIRKLFAILSRFKGD